jgi:hypothetical protein
MALFFNKNTLFLIGSKIFKIFSNHKEPHKHGHLAWVPLHNLPENILARSKQALEMILKGIKYFELGW